MIDDIQKHVISKVPSSLGDDHSTTTDSHTEGEVSAIPSVIEPEVHPIFTHYFASRPIYQILL